MSVTYLFLAEFTKSKVATTPANAPTIDIVDAANPAGALLVTAGSPTVMTNMAGVYVYSYTTATLTYRPVGLFKTADTTVDLQHIPSYPQVVLDANNNVLSAPDAATLRTALGLASANLDTQIATLATLTTLLKYVQLLARKDAAIATDNAVELTAINADGGSGAGAFSNQTDAEEALRDRGDAAWSTATGFAVPGDQMDLIDAPNATALATFDAVLSSVHGAGAWNTVAAGSGAVTYVYTVTVDGLPQPGVAVWVTTDVEGVDVVANAVTDAGGVVTFYLDPGAYYLWRQLSGYNFTNPVAETIV